MKKFKHKKSLGQNFLKNESVISDIVESAELSSESVVLEIGPGQGVLTEKLAEVAGKVIAVELDDRLIPVLEEKFRETENIEIVHDDILKVNLFEFSKTYNLKSKTYKVVANIPYYITAPIIRTFLESENQPSEIILMVQKEVAERLVAEPGEMSILAVSAQYYADVEYLFTVPREDFDPMPQVDSAIISLKVKNQKSKESKDFFRTVKIGFSAKRKTLANNLANGFQIDKKEVEKTLVEMGFSKSVRAQELSVDDWKKLAEFFK
ncbi:MAG: 16S rRNA (adenine(1518)-N(6)/adenine(1519)-N(6))-dimethyltransferase RsmA [Patescibacteria group bacterium]